jgi:hypothetical protein
MDKQSAREKLMTVTDSATADKVISDMFCEPPQDYFITSGDMVGKAGVWAHFGNWSFENAQAYAYFKSEPFDTFVNSMQTELGYDKQSAQRTYYDLSSLTTDTQINNWIAPWPAYGGQGGCTKVDNTTLTCNFISGLPLIINLTTHEATVNINNKNCYPAAIAYFDTTGNYVIKNYNNNTYWQCLKDSRGLTGIPEMSIVLNQQGNSYNIIYMNPQLTGSMFTRLFYLDGKGLHHFTKFYDETSVTGNRIITWNVDWQGK